MKTKQHRARRPRLKDAVARMGCLDARKRTSSAISIHMNKTTSTSATFKDAVGRLGSLDERAIKDAALSE
jgi:hypothetical protein